MKTKPINRKGYEVDKLSKLPDDILLAILDRLDARETARAGILARRWRQLPAMVSRLWINCSQFLPVGESGCPVDEIPRINARVVKATKSMLSRRDPDRHAIRSIAVTFFLIDFDYILIAQNVGRALARNMVKTAAAFTILTDIVDNKLEDRDRLNYGRKLLFFVDACRDAFSRLTYLALENLRFCREHDVPNVISTCARLRQLYMRNCDSEVWTTLRVEHLQLIELSITDCGFERLELSQLPELRELSFESWISFEDPISFGTVPLLEVVNLSNTCLSWHKMVKLSEFLMNTSVHNLSLEFNSEKIWIQPEVPKSLASVFHKLRVVHLRKLPEGVDLAWTMFFLEAAPLLEELSLALGVWDHTCEMETDEETRKDSYSEEKGVEAAPAALGFEHRSLASLVIFGFQSEDYLVTYVRHVMKVAVITRVFPMVDATKQNLDGRSFTAERMAKPIFLSALLPESGDCSSPVLRVPSGSAYLDIS